MNSALIARLLRDPVRAGDIYYRQGRLEKAVLMYARAGRFDQAARLSAELGRTEDAIEYFQQGEHHLEAGRLLAQSGEHRRAVPQLEKAGALWLAAESCIKLKQYHRAGVLLERAGQSLKAAQCFEEAKEWEEALRVLSRESQRLEEDDDGSLRNERHQLERRRGDILVRVGRFREAADLLTRWGSRDEAAKLLEKAGEFADAVRMYLDAGMNDRAAAILERATGVDIATRARVLLETGRAGEAAILLQDGGLTQEAAEAHEAAGSFEEAARLWEEAGDCGRAAELHYRLGAYRDAARCYEEAGRYRMAADSYAEVPEHAAAAACYRLAGDPLRAAEHSLAAGSPAEAVSALEGVELESAEYVPASLKLVPLLLEGGEPQRALERIRHLADAELGSPTQVVDRLYWEARSQEALGASPLALAAYERVSALRPTHRDVASRLVELRRQRDTGPVELRSDVVDPLFQGPAVPLQPGQLLAGRYELQGEIGRGGMGIVFRALDRELGEPVAIKTLRSERDPSEEERLLQEVRICRRIAHRNVVKVYDVGRFPGGLFVTMELLEGVPLSRLLKEVHSRGPFPVARVKGLADQVLAGLAEAHRLSVVHRDLKPANVVLVGEQAKILDFGIARMLGGDGGNLTMDGEAIGSPKYMSPEQLSGDELDGRSDLYSLGVLIYTLLAGREPFMGPNPHAIAVQHLQNEPPDIKQFRPDLSAPWVAFLARLLSKDPDERYASAPETRKVLNDLPVDPPSGPPGS